MPLTHFIARAFLGVRDVQACGWRCESHVVPFTCGSQSASRKAGRTLTKTIYRRGISGTEMHNVICSRLLSEPGIQHKHLDPSSVLSLRCTAMSLPRWVSVGLSILQRGEMNLSRNTNTQLDGYHGITRSFPHSEEQPSNPNVSHSSAASRRQKQTWDKLRRVDSNVSFQPTASKLRSVWNHGDSDATECWGSLNPWRVQDWMCQTSRAGSRSSSETSAPISTRDLGGCVVCQGHFCWHRCHTPPPAGHSGSSR